MALESAEQSNSALEHRVLCAEREQTNKSCPTELRAQGKGQAGGCPADDMSELFWKETRVPCTGRIEQQQISKPEVTEAAEWRSEGHPASRQHSGTLQRQRW